ncbi:fimbrial assembly family protein [Gottschalkia acidurici 9a]|uniref:Fimbrial assembly family protein n=1 Tax=Gottschalkia acidurici (strain ATCC 7906 / DSM 604 / BCRC 14475 / CIP 104303 / KCTC 5404 / NCIMB 10678 / 9a) TaxID=1128398 RepID=K0AVC4_GOTA9|nr:PilN domain-containing protein [Gottschalkia acidurici]AFS77803.1 fimbrial assembly family protein [Gottschalkia acidurici 9a]
MRDINFFESYINKKDNKIDRKKTILIGIGLIVFIVSIYVFTNKVRVHRLNKEIANITEELEGVASIEKKKSLNQKKDMLDNLKIKDQKVNIIINELQKKDNLGAHIIELITNSMSEDIFLKSMTINQSDVDIEGIGRNRGGIAKLEANIRQVRYFEDVFISNIVLEEEFYKFNIKIKFMENNKETKKVKDEKNNKKIKKDEEERKNEIK